MTLNSVARQIEKFTIDNSPAILTAIGATGALTTAYLAGKASWRAYEVIAAASPKTDSTREHPDMDFHDTKTKVQLVWKLYIPTAVSGLVSVTCIVSANRIGSRRAAALAAAYSLSEKAWSEYKEKVLEHIGPKEEEKVRDAVAQDQVTSSSTNSLILVGADKVLCLDSWSGRYFESTMEDIKKAVNDVNYQINHHMYASLSDFYDKIGIAETAESEEVGWNADKLLEVLFSVALTDDQRPCVVLEYHVVPIRGYNRLQ